MALGEKKEAVRFLDLISSTRLKVFFFLWEGTPKPRDIKSGWHRHMLGDGAMTPLLSI